ncbi:MAG: biotin--[acetyl-CoA-carboxylase] ligase [Austwickia sp.]|nr:biotin--[acetyl-CoA-carboxylase] ligase [Austwickia sp.]MBK9100412.1 biotin--[acetyl-CoA-carboxylase] ligase [Austwickia sp.]
MPPGLSQARLREYLLTPTGPWQHVDVQERVDSTNAWSTRDPRPWRVAVAGEQSAGRGRRGRDWSSPPGTSVSISLTVPMAADPLAWGWLPLLTGLATRDGLAEVTGASDPDAFVLKWPNDVLARESAADPAQEPRKICGILCETTADALVVAGIGVNVSVARQDLPVPTGTSLALCGSVVSRDDVVIAVARAFARWHERWYAGGAGLEEVRRSYRRHCGTIGAPVRIDLGVSLRDGPHPHDGVAGGAPAAGFGQVVEGTAVDVDETGEIVIQTTQGRRSFAAGDVVHLRRVPR